MVEYLMRFIGTPYIWAGNTPKGFDCSGLINEGLKSEGYIGHDEDLTAQMIHDRLIQGYRRFSPDLYMIQKNDLLFFGPSVKNITHVAIAYDSFQMLEAGGAGKDCKTVEDAVRLNAFVRLRPIAMRKDLVATVRL